MRKPATPATHRAVKRCSASGQDNSTCGRWRWSDADGRQRPSCLRTREEAFTGRHPRGPNDGYPRGIDGRGFGTTGLTTTASNVAPTSSVSVHKGDSVHKGEVEVGGQERHKVATVQRVTRHRGLLPLCLDRNTSRDSSRWPLFRPPNAQLRPRRIFSRAGQLTGMSARAPGSPS